MRERCASASASAPASMSSLRVRQSVATVALRAVRATARTPSKSPGEDTAKPASITSTPRSSSWFAISTFSSVCSAMPGDCSPSRSVVSQIAILRELTEILLAASFSGRTSAANGGRMRLRRVFAYSP